MTIWYTLAKQSRFETDRLRCRPLDWEDRTAVFRLLSSSEGSHFVVPRLDDQETCDRFLAAVYLRQPLGIWVLQEQTTGRLIGLIRLEKIQESRKQAELVYFLGQAYRGQGLMAEVVSMLCTLLVEQGSFNCLCIVSHEDNPASQKVAERAGFSLYRQYKGSDRQSHQMKAYREYRYSAQD